MKKWHPMYEKHQERLRKQRAEGKMWSWKDNLSPEQIEKVEQWRKEVDQKDLQIISK